MRPAAIRMLLLALTLGLTGTACERESAAEDPAGDPPLLDRLTSAPRGVDLHLVRIGGQGDAYAFEPSELVVRRGDLVRFVMVSSQPQSVSFELTELSPEAQAFVRENELLHGELLTSSGEVYDVSFQDAPPGRYHFRSVVHAARGMRGVVVVNGGSE
jgi:plastocyanin